MLRCSSVIAMIFVLSACSDGVGRPIRQQAASVDQDAAFDEDGGGRSHELDLAHCAETFAWPDGYARDEEELLEAINAQRREGIRCGDRGGESLRPLELAPALRCSARLHSLDMVERDFTDRINPDGEGPRERMRRAGFEAEETDESIVVSERGALSAFEVLLDSWEDCAHIAARELTDVGIGRYQDHWTLDFAGDFERD